MHVLYAADRKQGQRRCDVRDAARLSWAIAAIEMDHRCRWSTLVVPFGHADSEPPGCSMSKRNSTGLVLLNDSVANARSFESVSSLTCTCGLKEKAVTATALGRQTLAALLALL